MTYNDLTRRHFATAAHAGELSGLGTRRGMAGDRASGTWVQFDVQVDPAPGGAEVVRVVRFRAYGCPHVIAVADWLAEQAAGRELLPGVSGLPLTVTALQQRFGVPTEKRGRLLVVEDAWIAAFSAPCQQPMI